MDKKTMVQVQLVHANPQTTMITWLEKDRRVKPGATITLKEYGEQEWKVSIVFGIEIPIDILKMNHGWTNNI